MSLLMKEIMMRLMPLLLEIRSARLKWGQQNRTTCSYEDVGEGKWSGQAVSMRSVDQ